MNLRKTMRLSSLVLPAILLLECAWFKAEEPAITATPPQPVGGYTEIQKRLYYPMDVRNQGVEGRVVVNVFIDTAGVVQKTVVVDSLDAQLNRIASMALAATPFIPAQQAGQKVAVWVSFPVEFSLQDIPHLQSPYEDVTARIQVSETMGTSKVELTFTLLHQGGDPHMIEFKIPFTAERTLVEALAGERWDAVDLLRQVREGEDWGVASVEARRFRILFTLKDLREMFPNTIPFVVQVSHQLPAWECEVLIPGNGMILALDTGQARRLDAGDDGSRYLIRFPPLPAYNTQHIELKLLQGD